MSKTLSVATLSDEFKLEVEDDYSIPDLDGLGWLYVESVNGKSLAIHTRQINSIRLGGGEPHVCDQAWTIGKAFTRSDGKRCIHVKVDTTYGIRPVMECLVPVEEE